MTSKNCNKGQRIVRVTPEFLEQVLKGRTIKNSTLPDDARLVSLTVCEESAWHYWIKFESSEWDALREGQKIPTVDAQIELGENGERKYYLGGELKSY